MGVRKNWDYKCKKRCGRCCIICTDAQLTWDEVKEGKYEMKRRNGKGNLNEWSNMVLRRKLIYSKELKRDIYACFYFKPENNECLIYEDRPLVCHNFNCEDCEENQTGKMLHRIWVGLLDGRDDYLCLEK